MKVFKILAGYLLIIALFGVFEFTRPTEKPKDSIESLVSVNNSAFKEIADANGWTIVSSQTGSLSILFMVKTQSGAVIAVNSLTIRDPFGTYRTLLPDTSETRRMP